MNRDFWNNRRVLVTGHTGFKGSWLCLWLKQLSARVTGFALPPPTDPSLFELADVGQGIDSVIGDVRDVESLTRVVRESRPEVVLHLAAQSLVRRSYDDPLETYSTNVLGSANLFQAIREAGGCRVVVNVTSDKCYENHEWIWGYRENDELGGRDPYSNSKACSELVTRAFRDSFFSVDTFSQHRTAIATARAGNVIGGGDWTEDQLIPDVIRAFNDGRPVSIRRPGSIRPWQHVLDCLGGYLTLAEKLAYDGASFSGAWNFGPAVKDARTVGWIVEELCRRWGDDASWVQDSNPHPHEAAFLRLDNSKAVAQLGWRPRLSLEDALDWTVEWYKGLGSNLVVKDVCERQIERYAGLEALESSDA